MSDVGAAVLIVALLASAVGILWRILRASPRPDPNPDRPAPPIPATAPAPLTYVIKGATGEVLTSYEGLAAVEPPSFDLLLRHLKDLGPLDGTATPRQVAAVQRLGLRGEMPQLARIHAHAILSAREYSEAVIYSLIRQTDGYHGERLIEAYLVAYVISNPPLRDRVLRWSARSFARGGFQTVGKPKHDAHFDDLRQYAAELLGALR